MSQTIVVRPLCKGVAIALTTPSFLLRIWLALISIPTGLYFVKSTFIAVAILAAVSAKATDAPPCKIPAGCLVFGPTGIVITTWI